LFITFGIPEERNNFAMKNPFEFGKVITGQTFLNRDEERKRLKANLKSGVNTILISPRRWGKTSLVAQVGMETACEKVVICYLDLFNIRNEEDFYKKFTNSVIKASSSNWEEWIVTAKKFLKNLVPRFSFGDDPVHDFTLTIDYSAIQQSAEEALNLPEQIALEKKIRLVVCIDEFQNLAYFDDPLAFQKQLRSYWQHHQEVSYVIYGSKKNLMTALFQERNMPFYRFGDLISLQKIKKEHWVPFISDNFSSTGKNIIQEVASRIPDLMENHPYYVQFLSYHCWNLTSDTCTLPVLHEALEEVLQHQAILFQSEIGNLTNFQLNFLKALANGEEQFTSMEILNKYHLGSPGNVNRIKSALVSKEIIDVTGKKNEISDPLFKIWILKNF
jgi:uncharacterized protein